MILVGEHFFVTGNWLIDTSVLTAFLIAIILLLYFSDKKDKQRLVALKKVKIPLNLPAKGLNLPYFYAGMYGTKRPVSDANFILFNDRFEFHRFPLIHVKENYSNLPPIDYLDNGEFNTKIIVGNIEVNMGPDEGIYQLLSFFKRKKVALTSKAAKFIATY